MTILMLCVVVVSFIVSTPILSEFLAYPVPFVLMVAVLQGATIAIASVMIVYYLAK